MNTCIKVNNYINIIKVIIMGYTADVTRYITDKIRHRAKVI